MNGMEIDGIHPNFLGHSRWEDGLSERILKFQWLNTMAP
jgi:lysophospholipase L1-like esterase